MGSTPADRPGLTGKQSCGPAYLLRLLFSGVSPKGRRQLGVVGLFPFSRRYDVDASVRVATAYRVSTNANKNHLHLLCNCCIMISTKTTSVRTKPLRARAGRPSGSGSCLRVAVLLPPVLFFGVSDRAGNRLRLSAPFFTRSFLLPFCLYVSSPFR